MNPDIFTLCKIASCGSSKNYQKLDSLLKELKIMNLTPIYEVILQLYLFNGFPATIESLKVFKHHFPDFKPDNEQYNVNLFEKRGIINCKSVYTSNYDKLQNNITNLSLDLAEWMIIEGYGKVLGRNGLSLQDRELLNVAMLCTNYSEHQLYSHIKGAYNTGSGIEIIKEVIESTREFNTGINIKNALELVNIINNSDTQK